MLTLFDLNVVVFGYHEKEIRALGCGVWDALGMCMVVSLILILLGRVLHRGSSGGFVLYPCGWISK